MNGSAVRAAVGYLGMAFGFAAISYYSIDYIYKYIEDNYFPRPTIRKFSIWNIEELLNADVEIIQISEDMLSVPDASIPYINKNGVIISFLKNKYVVHTCRNDSMNDFKLCIGDRVFKYEDEDDGKIHLIPFDDQIIMDWSYYG